MSDSKRDQRGKRINGEIRDTPRIISGKLVLGFKERGSPASKLWVKRVARRCNRRLGQQLAKVVD